MQHRQNIPKGTEWARKLCYSRAVRIGPFVAVSGKIVGRRDPQCQAVYALKDLKKTLDAAGVKLTDVIRTRVYLARFEHWEASRSA